MNNCITIHDRLYYFCARVGLFDKQLQTHEFTKQKHMHIQPPTQINIRPVIQLQGACRKKIVHVKIINISINFVWF